MLNIMVWSRFPGMFLCKDNIISFPFSFLPSLCPSSLPPSLPFFLSPFLPPSLPSFFPPSERSLPQKV